MRNHQPHIAHQILLLRVLVIRKMKGRLLVFLEDRWGKKTCSIVLRIHFSSRPNTALDRDNLLLLRQPLRLTMAFQRVPRLELLQEPLVQQTKRPVSPSNGARHHLQGQPGFTNLLLGRRQRDIRISGVDDGGSRFLLHLVKPL